MNFWTRINTRWSEEDLLCWSSLSKSLYLIFPVIVYFLAGEIVQMLLINLVSSYYKANTAEEIIMSSDLYMTIYAMIYGIGLIVSLSVIYKGAKAEITYKEPENMEGDRAYRSLFIPLLACSALSVAVAIGLNYLFFALGITESSEEYMQVKDAQYGMYFLVGLILFGVLSPVVEEVMFRGMLYNRLKRMFPLYLSMGISALLFGVFHGNLVQGIYGFLMGIVIVFCYEKFKSFWIPVSMHIVANVVVYVLNYTVWR